MPRPLPGFFGRLSQPISAAVRLITSMPRGSARPSSRIATASLPARVASSSKKLSTAKLFAILPGARMFDGRSGDFATEMFVIINSTHTRINRSHLVDLYEKVSWESPEKKFAARLANLLYGEDDSPLQYKINRLGGRSKQEKWILQSEVFNELLKLVVSRKRWLESNLGMRTERCYALIRDYFKGVKDVMVDVWGINDRYMFTRDVTLKALIRVLDELMVDRKLLGEWQAEQSHKPFADFLKPWAAIGKEFRAEGFYERFPAKGQLERVRKVQQRLLDALTS